MNKLVVLTGAGMSAESGMATFRDSDGLWENHRVEEVATPEAFASNPRLVLDFYNQRRKELYSSSPNEGHLGLAALEKHFKVEIITQNVDDLHERAGSTSIIHLHGELTKSLPADGRGEVKVIPEGTDLNLGDTDVRGVQLRPFIVWFGEPVPMIDHAISRVQEASVFVVIGSSLSVYPAAGLLHYVPKGRPVFLIDPNEMSAGHYKYVRKGSPVFVVDPGNPGAVPHSGTNFIKSGASEGVRLLTQILLQPGWINELT
jgi:NAD-dependent deacetylase